MSEPAVLIASAKLRPGQDRAFSAWQAHHNAVIGKFPGFVSSEVMPPSQPGGNEWTIVLNFRSQDDLTAWQRSGERAKIVGEAIPLLEPVKEYLGLGLTGFGLAPHRPGDSIGVGMAWSWLNPNLGDRSSELMFQGYYQTRIAEGVYPSTHSNLYPDTRRIA